jgi:hypothetical protein
MFGTSEVSAITTSSLYFSGSDQRANAWSAVSPFRGRETEFDIEASVAICLR